jgi:hypothetical protein
MLFMVRLSNYNYTWINRINVVVTKQRTKSNV